ncbi:MAG: DUF3320 domain-containing protein [Solidesulfovibrio sp.]|uniref:DUF3320 domain-containing protein n=1 Tax=Solidesulfovibrio sp. TaxID=2910990 RepID=UPI003158010C
MTELADTTIEMAIKSAFSPKVSFALHQNSIPVLLELSVENNGDHAREDLVLSLHSVPAFFRSRDWQISKISPQQRYTITDLDLNLDGGQLFRLTEAEKSQIVFELRQGETSLCRLEQSVALLARNEWGGLNQFPELAAAFVRPNDPAVDRVLRKAADLLHQTGKESALEGYKTGGKLRVWEIMAAIWQAICSLSLNYALPPAGFEQQGQKVRSPEQILQNGLATCLDLTFLFASCLEQCRLHPLLVFIEGHAFAGAWLVPEVFATTAIDDVTALRKRLQLQEILLFEPTLAVRGQQDPAKFKWSCEVGARQVSEEEPRPFQLALDIQRARMERILPLASEESLVQPAPPEVSATQIPDVLDFDDVPDLMEVETQPESTTPSGPQDRLGNWQRKLLDLSLRNNLLNFRSTRRVVELMVPDPGHLEDMLADGKRFKLRPGIRLMQGNDPRDETIHQARHKEEVGREHAREGLGKGELYTCLSEEDMERRLVELFRASRMALQEGGANTLYLVLGFLVWTQDGKDGRRLRAPLILIPVTLNRQAVRSGFSLASHEDEPRFNLTLLEMLRQDFHLSLPGLESELPHDDSGLDVLAIWRTVATAIKDMPGWEVAEEVSLGQFSFAKYLMWKDLTDHTEELKRNPVVRHLIDTPTETYGDRAAFIEPGNLDRHLHPSHNFCPLPADSSQLAAVVAAAQGNDFVLEGPPGTGKSQTIANLIAQCLAMNKTVLFVAEKTAALDVVYRRLKEVELGEFCLELHSHKANKLEVLKQLQQSWDARVSVDQSRWEQEAARMGFLRDQLNALVNTLHRRWPNGLSVFTAISKTLSARDMVMIPLRWSDPGIHDKENLDRLMDIATRLGINAGQVMDAPKDSLALVTATEWSPGWEDSLSEALRQALMVCEETETAGAHFFAATGLPAAALAEPVRQALTSLAGLLREASGRDWSFLLRHDGPDLLVRLGEGESFVGPRRALLAELLEQDAAGAPTADPADESLAPWPELEESVQELERKLSRYRAGAKAISVSPFGESQDAPISSGLDGLRQEISSLATTAKAVHKTALTRLQEGQALVTERQRLWDQLSRDYLPEALNLDLEGHRQTWRQAATAWWPKNTLARGKVRKALQAVAKAKPAATPNDTEDLDRLIGIRDLDAKLAAFEDLKDPIENTWGWPERQVAFQAAFDRLWQKLNRAATIFNALVKIRDLDTKLSAYTALGPATGGLWKGVETRAEDLVLARKLGEGLKASLAGLYDCPETLKAGVEALQRLVGENNLLLSPSSVVARAGADFEAKVARLRTALITLKERCGSDTTGTRSLEALTSSQLADYCRDILARPQLLRLWCAWNRVVEEAHAVGLGVLAEALDKGSIVAGQAREAFAINYCRWWLRAVVDGDVLLRRFVSVEHEQVIDDFRHLDRVLANLARDCIRAIVRQDVPEAEETKRASEWGVLRREMAKKRRHLPLRQLLEQLPTALPRLTPCLLMSPLSIAQYLPPSRALFDLVVFDEASQIPVWDAIGAMARGKQVVVVGDPKQLPPTNFFNRAEDEDADDSVEIGGDMESILNECLSAGLPCQRLNWHYRSRHESLIAFSNNRYYGSGLVTFPSPVTDDSAVSLHLVEGGHYDKGGSRTNQVEAKAVVADIVRHLQDSDFVASGKSIGVVTFNSQQQKLIEDLLDEERRRDTALERFFSEDLTEPVFVKNLENVQGDERDLIYFSITYGPDLAGRVSMNFGPLNKDGGERRLNVAVTRAKHGLRIFTSLLPDQIDLMRTKAKGVADLKLFLDYAQRGIRALAEETTALQGDFESPFEEIVAAALSRRGWTVHPQVGVSAFRVDLGVVDPERAGRYLAGVECDGATYHRAATARDRDWLREQVLKGLGWRIVRTWSTDWWHDAETAAKTVDTKLRKILEETREEQAKAEAERARQEAAQREAPETTSDEMRASPADGNDSPRQLSLLSAPAADVPSEPAAEAVYAFRSVAQETSSVAAPDVTTTSPDLLADGQETALADAIREIVAAEGPVRSDVLARRIAKRCGLYKAGSKIREKVLKVASQEFTGFAEEDGGVFFWPVGTTLGQWDLFRMEVNGESRPADEISLAELAALACAVSTSLAPAEDPVAVMARMMGLQRLRAVTRARLERAWEMRLSKPDQKATSTD